MVANKNKTKLIMCLYFLHVIRWVIDFIFLPIMKMKKIFDRLFRKSCDENLSQNVNQNNEIKPQIKTEIPPTVFESKDLIIKWENLIDIPDVRLWNPAEALKYVDKQKYLLSKKFGSQILKLDKSALPGAFLHHDGWVTIKQLNDCVVNKVVSRLNWLEEIILEKLIDKVAYKYFACPYCGNPNVYGECTMCGSRYPLDSQSQAEEKARDEVEEMRRKWMIEISEPIFVNK